MGELKIMATVQSLSKEIIIEASGVRPEASFEINIPHLSSAYIWEDICCKYTATHGNPVICEWHFIEESVPESYAFGTHIHHFFRTVGLHQIQLTVTDTVTGISSIITRNVEVQAGIVDFMHSVSQQETEWGDPLPLTAYVDVPTQFRNTSTIEGISWLWDFGDGTISTEFCPLHTFDTEAIYEVTLTITLKNSETLSIIKSVEISSFPTLPPFAKTLYEANNAEGIIVFNVQDNYTGVVDITEYPNGTISLNREYYKQSEASGGTLDYTFSVVSGSLPPGVVFNENDGTFEGIPTEEGVYTFELFVIDQQFRTDTQTCVLTVIPFTYDPLVIWTEYLTHGQTCLNKSYSEYILITGGVLPYSFSIDNGVLPYGMYINENLAQITGTAKKEGIYSFDFSVIDSIGLIKTKRYTIEVVDCGDDFTSRLFPSYMSETVTVKDNFHQKYLYDYLPLSIKEFKDS